MTTKGARFITAVALACVLPAAPAAQEKKADASKVTGTWNMGLQGDHVIPTALVLEQDGSKVTGTIALPTQNQGQRVDVKLTGEFAGGSLTLSGTVEHAAQPTTIEITGTMKEDGTLEGGVTLSGHGNLTYTAERLKERKKTGSSR